MAFNFGASTKSKQKKIISDDLYILDNFDESENDYYLFLVEGHLDKSLEIRLESDIKKAGFKSYLIVSGTSIKNYHETKISGSKTKFLIDNCSTWKRFLNYKNKHVSGVMLFGDMLYLVNHGTDIETDAFISPFVKSYYYLGSGFIGNYDTFFFPVYATNVIYSRDPKNPANVIYNWTTKFFQKQLERMLLDKKLPDMDPYTITIIKSKEEASELLERYKGSDICSFDLETSGLDSILDSIKCITLAFDTKQGYYIDWDYIDVKQLSDLFRTCEVLMGVNAKFDIKFLWRNGLDRDIYPTDDAMLLSHAFHSDRNKGLKSLAFYYTYFGGYDDKLDVFKKETGINDYSKIPEHILSEYATLDVIVALRAFNALIEQVNNIDEVHPNEKAKYTGNSPWSIYRWYKQLIMGIYPAAVDAEYEGVYIDFDILKKNRQTLKDLNDKYVKELAEIFNVPESFEFSSLPKLGKLLEEKGWPCVGRNSKGEYLTNDLAIAEWQRQNIKGINELVNYRKINVLISTFLGKGDLDLDYDSCETYEEKFEMFKREYRNKSKDLVGWEKHLRYHPEDDSWRMHCDYVICGTTTFRFIGKNPNLQQIPTRGKFAYLVKQCFSVPRREYYEIVDDDGSVMKYYPGDFVNTTRGNIPIEDLREDDVIVKERIVRRIVS